MSKTYLQQKINFIVFHIGKKATTNIFLNKNTSCKPGSKTKQKIQDEPFMKCFK